MGHGGHHSFIGSPGVRAGSRACNTQLEKSPVKELIYFVVVLISHVFYNTSRSH